MEATEQAYRAFQRQVDRVCTLILFERPECEIESARIELRSEAERLFPDKAQLYEIIYESLLPALGSVSQARRRFTMTMQEHEEEVRFQIGGVMLAGTLAMPERALGIVLFAHGSGSSRHSPRNRFVAATLRKAGLGTLLFDLLTGDEEAEDLVTGRLRFDIPFLAGRLLGATDWIAQNPATERLRIGCFGSSTGGAAALMASVERLEKIGAIVCRGSRTDMAKVVLARVAAPTLLIVGERDETVLEWNRESFAELRCEKQLEIIPAATHLFEESGTLEEVARLAAEWFRRWLAPGGN